ncbi:MAG: hypothetical protein J0L93_00685 [Deltaproteobacteria bacterium]|nr:hypothetical protein [Deltaproteobacteria bacterium]
MKKFIRFVTLAILLQTSFQLAEVNAAEVSKPISEKKYSLGLSIFTLVVPMIEVPIGAFLNPNLRVSVAPTMISSFYGSSALDSFLIGGTFATTFFFDDWSGWYLEPAFVYLHGIKKKDSRDSNVDMVGAQLIGGYEKVWNSGLFMNFGFGLGVGKVFYDDRDDYLRVHQAFPYPTYNALFGTRF